MALRCGRRGCRGPMTRHTLGCVLRRVVGEEVSMMMMMVVVVVVAAAATEYVSIQMDQLKGT